MLAATLPLAKAIAGSSAFPLTIDPLKFTYKTVTGDHSAAVITDGGVYDNLGLDPLFGVNAFITNPFYKEGSDKFSIQNSI
jgi:hypothetical protein